MSSSISRTELVDLERHGLVFGEQFVSLLGHIAKKRAQ